MIDATGLVVAPGFIDVQGQSGTTLLADGNGESHLRQGITSEIIGEGGSPAFWTPDTRRRAKRWRRSAWRSTGQASTATSTAAPARHDDQPRHVRAGDDGAARDHRHGQPPADRR